MTGDLLDKKEERIRQMFAAIAPWYDRLNHLLSLNIDTIWRRTTVRLVPPRGTAPILDVCTGTGDLALEYDRVARGRIAITGSDFCPPMLARATQKAGPRRGQRVRFIEADAQQLPFAADTFQIVSVAFGLRNVTDFRRGLAEMVRVAQPGGRVAILEFSRPRHWLFGTMYRWYFKYLLPKIGQWFSRSPDDAYSYLPASVFAFPDGEELAAELRSAGLTKVWYRPLTFGIATLYVGIKPRKDEHEPSPDRSPEVRTR